MIFTYYIIQYIKSEGYFIKIYRSA